jgi:hypothetical protein
VVLFPLDSRTKSVNASLLSSSRATSLAHLIFYWIVQIIFREQYKSFSSSLCNLLHSFGNIRHNSQIICNKPSSKLISFTFCRVMVAISTILEHQILSSQCIYVFCVVIISDYFSIKSVFLWVWNSVCHTEGGKKVPDGIWEIGWRFISVINQLDAQNFCFTMRLFHDMFQAHVLIIRRSKLHYTASGIITAIGGHLVHETAIYTCDDTRGCVMQFWPPDDEHMCLKHIVK